MATAAPRHYGGEDARCVAAVPRKPPYLVATSVPRFTLAAAAAALVAALLWIHRADNSGPRVVRPDPPLAREAAPRDAPAHPMPPAPIRALPPLAQSDAVVRDAVRKVEGAGELARMLAAGDLVLRFVDSVDRISSRSLPRQAFPIVIPVAPYDATTERAAHVLEQADYARYVPLVDVLDAVDMHGAASVYWRLYPLLQQAYEQLGVHKGYFNDRVVEIIDHLLQTPAPGAPIAVVSGGGLLRFEDPRLEACSAGQKALLRMGPANAARVESKLRQLRQLLVLRAPTR